MRTPPHGSIIRAAARVSLCRSKSRGQVRGRMDFRTCLAEFEARSVRSRLRIVIVMLSPFDGPDRRLDIGVLVYAQQGVGHYRGQLAAGASVARRFCWLPMPPALSGA